jgi:4a-hydroxytetrahydrobiopterin dehydratase
MKIQSAAQLAKQKCQPCEGGVQPMWPQESVKQLAKLDGWRLSKDGQRIRKEWVVKDFAEGMKFLKEIARIAEKEDHHPDLHLSGYRNVAVEISTHAIGGLSENDFILAAKIEQLPVELRAGKK